MSVLIFRLYHTTFQEARNLIFDGILSLSSLDMLTIAICASFYAEDMERVKLS
jgi:hypothetical protein